MSVQVSLARGGVGAGRGAIIAQGLGAARGPGEGLGAAREPGEGPCHKPHSRVVALTKACPPSQIHALTRDLDNSTRDYTR